MNSSACSVWITPSIVSQKCVAMMSDEAAAHRTA